MTRARLGEPAIEVRDVSKSFKIYSDKRTGLKEAFVDRRRADRASEFWALNRATLDIPRGTTFGLIGHNGSGKSTLLKLIAGIHRPTSGTITTHGRISAMLELGAGFHPELTGRENIYLNGSILGMNRRQIDDAMDDIISFSGLAEFIDTPVKVYSSGMYVRLGFAIAVNLDPEILIVDEVIAVGDEEFQRKCFDHLYELRRRGTTIVLVSHSLGLVADLCDQVALIDHGRVLGVGEARPLIDQYIAMVNEREAAIADPSTDTSDRDINATRSGSGEVRVTKVELLDGDGKVVPFLLTGRPAALRVHYESELDLDEVTFGIGFVHEAGIEVAGPNSGAAEPPLAISKGIGYIDYTLSNLTLQPGTFSLSTIVADKGHVFEHRDRAFIAKVRADHVVTETGLVTFDGRWSSPISTRELDVVSSASVTPATEVDRDA